MGTAGQNWEQQCRQIQNACSSSNWSQVIEGCNELIQYAQQQAGVTSVLTAHSNEQQQLLIQAHAEQD